MPYQGGDQNTHFRGHEWNFPYQKQFGAMQQHNSAVNGQVQVQSSGMRNHHHISSDILPLNDATNANVNTPSIQNCGGIKADGENQNNLANSIGNGNSNIQPKASCVNDSEQGLDLGSKTLGSDIVSRVSSILSDPNLLQNALYSQLKDEKKKDKSQLGVHCESESSTSSLENKIPDGHTSAIEEIVKATLKAVVPVTSSTSVTSPPPQMQSPKSVR